MNFIKTIGIALGIGLLTMLLGALIMKISGKAEIKPQLITFFILGFILYLLLEFTGAHKSFCLNYK